MDRRLARLDERSEPVQQSTINHKDQHLTVE
jgi:hypothetical protein